MRLEIILTNPLPPNIGLMYESSNFLHTWWIVDVGAVSSMPMDWGRGSPFKIWLTWLTLALSLSPFASCSSWSSGTWNSSRDPFGEGGPEVSSVFDLNCTGSNQRIKGFVAVPKTCYRNSLGQKQNLLCEATLWESEIIPCRIQTLIISVITGTWRI